MRDQGIVELKKEIESLKKANLTATRAVESLILDKQCAWIEWTHGNGSKSAMVWIHNSLVGPNLIPDKNEPFGKDAQGFYNHNIDILNRFVSEHMDHKQPCLSDSAESEVQE